MQDGRLVSGSFIVTLALAACSSQAGIPGRQQSVVPTAGVSPAHASRYKVAYDFPGGAGGEFPVGALTFANGMMFGATVLGGETSGCNCGTIFAGKKVIYTFKGASSQDGANPTGVLLLQDGELYGVTTTGGRSDGVCASNPAGTGCGTVFAIDTSGNERVIYRFKGGRDGETPVGGLVSFNGSMYGVTVYGGTNGTCGLSSVPAGCGTIFAIDKSGYERIAYRFKGSPDGAFPFEQLLVFKNNLYGTTYFGGGCDAYVAGCGTVFRLSTSGTESVIYAFKGGNDGLSPDTALIPMKGSLWGATVQGGCVSSCQSSLGFGTLYKISPTGTESVVHRFVPPQRGGNPQGTLVVWNKQIFGTTANGGTGHNGIIFSVSAGGVKTRYAFSQQSTGSGPFGLSLPNSSRALYGLAHGGTSGDGVIFRFVP